tara:strand:- start:4434 stop:5294 length:861 start_codon:yes stop_codon:yes gene_type:complete
MIKELGNLKQVLNIESNKNTNFNNDFYKKRLDELTIIIDEISNIYKNLNHIDTDELNLLYLKYKNTIITNPYALNKKYITKINKTIKIKIKKIHKECIDFYKDKKIDNAVKITLMGYFNFINEIIIILSNNITIKSDNDYKNIFDNIFKTISKTKDDDILEDINDDIYEDINDDILEDDTVEDVNFDVNDYMYFLVNCKKHNMSLSNVNSLIKMLIENNSVKYINTQLEELKINAFSREKTDILLKNFNTEYNIKTNTKSKFYDFVNDLNDLNEKDLKKIVKAYKK